MVPLVISLLVVGAGIYIGVRNLRLLRNQVALREYMRRGPKATFWVPKYELDGATKLARQFFLPSGLAIAAVMVVLGGWSLGRIYP